jgi:filamentous hemagglutinin
VCVASTEYKILNTIAGELGDNFTAKGTISLFTERPPCDSCKNVIIQFLAKYKNIVIDVVHNSSVVLKP